MWICSSAVLCSCILVVVSDNHRMPYYWGTYLSLSAAMQGGSGKPPLRVCRDEQEQCIYGRSTQDLSRGYAAIAIWSPKYALVFVKIRKNSGRWQIIELKLYFPLPHFFSVLQCGWGKPNPWTLRLLLLELIFKEERLISNLSASYSDFY